MGYSAREVFRYNVGSESRTRTHLWTAGPPTTDPDTPSRSFSTCQPCLLPRDKMEPGPWHPGRPACLPGPKGTQGCMTDGSPPGWFSHQAPTHGKPKLCHAGKILPWAGCPRLPAGPLFGLMGGGQRMPGQACFSEWFTANAFLGHQGPLLCGHSGDGAEVARGAQ